MPVSLYIVAPFLFAFGSGETLTRNPGETIKHFAARMLPPKTQLAHLPLEGTFGPGAGNIVVLFQPAEGVDTNYSGLVLVPVQEGRYRKIELPKLSEIPGRFEITVKSVFFEDIDGDSSPELFILSNYHRNGATEDDTDAVAIYRWTGDAFSRLDEKIEGKFTGLHTAAAVRNKIRAAKKLSPRRP